MNHLLALGCSHTAGVGVEADQCYANLVSQALGLTLVNHAVPGGNHITVQKNLVEHLQQHRPSQIIAQWPNIYRTTVWQQGRPCLLNSNIANNIYNQLLQAGPENFVEPWIQTIVVCNMLCKALEIPMLNILLEHADQYIHNELSRFDVVLHQDQKLPGQSWIFDSAGNDGLHHSAKCHALWAQRILTII